MSAKDIVKMAEKLEADAKRLREAADILGYVTRVEAQPYQGTRADQLANFLKEHGGQATRTEIVSESGIPPGTIASLLGSKKKFAKDGRGFWHPKGKAQQEDKKPELALAQA